MYVGGDAWLLWRPLPALDVRVEVKRLAHLWAPVGLSVRTTDDDKITGSTLRDLPMGQLERALRDPEVIEALDRSGSPRFNPARCSTEQAQAKVEAIEREMVGWEPVELQLEIPRPGRRDDAFYEGVWRIHQDVAKNSHRPAAVIAEANGVAISTVHGWLKEHKRRSKSQ
ncbi:MAG: hypothetical protein JWM89_3515 [Acidimicrobiales bacterium]|nr:hypothetical protein [Acidimicrobiales bacterium]